MASKVYSVRFTLLQGAGSATYVVPAGKRAVLKSIMGWNGDSGPANVSISIGGTVVWFTPVPGASALTSPPIMVVLYKAEQLQVSHGAAGLRSVVSGYLLDDP